MLVLPFYASLFGLFCAFKVGFAVFLWSLVCSACFPVVCLLIAVCFCVVLLVEFWVYLVADCWCGGVLVAYVS